MAETNLSLNDYEIVITKRSVNYLRIIFNVCGGEECYLSTIEHPDKLGYIIRTNKKCLAELEKYDWVISITSYSPALFKAEIHSEESSDSEVSEPLSPNHVRLLEKLGEMMNDDSISEDQKNAMATVYTLMEINKIRKAPVDPAFQKKWLDAHTPILNAIIFEPCVIKAYDWNEEGQTGLYLECDLDNYIVKLDIEDPLTLEEFYARKCISIEVMHKERDVDGEIIFNSGLVETIEEAKLLVGYLERSDQSNLGRENFDQAMRLLFRLGAGQNYKVARTIENLEALVQKSRTNHTVSQFEP